MSNFLTRTRPAAPVRMVHLGLGNFYRAHQAWFTQRASDAADWGYAAFEGRGNKIAPVLQAQDNVYTLAFAHASGDEYERIDCISKTHVGTDFDAWTDYFARPEVAIASLTVTEAGYLVSNGALDSGNEQFVADLAILKAGGNSVISAPARLVAGLRARRAAESGPMAVMSCDNLPNNGSVLRAVVLDAAKLVDPTLATWISDNVSFVTTMVDRITPRVTDDDVARINAGIGAVDGSPIVAEPFGEWVISGDFPAGRPNWESAGVTFAADVEPHERRKLWLLNGSHSLLAYVGLRRGFTFVDEAMQDAVCDDTVVSWWEQAIGQLEGDRTTLSVYADELRKRYENPRIRYQLAQIGTDGSLKIPVRWIPGVKAMRAAGVLPTAAARGFAAYGYYLHGDDVRDARKEQLLGCVGGNVNETVRNFLGFVAPELLSDSTLLACIDSEIASL